MKVYLHNMETGDDTEVEIPPLHQLRVVLDGSVPNRGANTRRILDFSQNGLYDENGERLGIHAKEGLIHAMATAANDWVIGVTG